MNQGGLIYQKYRNGEKLTDREVIIGRDLFKAAADATILCGPYFNIAFVALNSAALNLESVAKARNIKRLPYE